MKTAAFTLLVLLSGWTSSAFAAGGGYVTDTWLPHTNNCNDHLWDNYCCEKSCHGKQHFAKAAGCQTGGCPTNGCATGNCGQ